VRRLLIVGILLGVGIVHAVTKVSAGSGDWGTNGTWSPSGVPACGDSIVILTGHTVTISANQNYHTCASRMAVVIQGTLSFSNMSKLRLGCNASIYVYPAGQIISPSGGVNDRIEICGTEYWDGSNGPINGPACLPPGGPCGTILPVSLSAFYVNCCGSGVCAEWETLTELRTDHFELQRSVSGDDYETVAEVPSFSAGGESHLRLVYRAEDASPLRGRSYYRLAMVDTDGGVEYSRLKSIAYSTQASTGYFFNEVGQLVLSVIPGALQKGDEVSIVNLMGQQLWKGTVTSGNSGLLVVDGVSSQTADMLVCNVRSATGLSSVKIIRQ
jgi:hypothetical protein